MKHVYTFPVFCILSRAVLSSCMLSVIAIPSYADQQLAAEEPRFTVNFNDTSVIEVIRFVSKITGANFVFSEEDLSFNVTIVSQEPISAKNISSVLVQVLRMHGYKLLEQEGNCLITADTNPVNQIPTLIVDSTDGVTAPIVTQIFTIKNTDITALANLIRPMLSHVSLLEIFGPTSQLLLTDVTTNVEKVGALIQALDIPFPDLEIESFVPQNASLDTLFTLAKELLRPFAGTTPLLFVPQETANTLFIVSTASLLERTMSILEDLDASPAVQANQDLHLYQVQGESPEDFLASLQNSTTPITKAGASSLATSIQNAKVIPNTGSLLIATSKEDWHAMQEFLTSFDTSRSNGRKLPYLHKVHHSDPEQFRDLLSAASQKLDDKRLSAMIDQAEWIPETESFLFTGTDSALRKLKAFVQEFDASLQETGKETSYPYSLVHLTKDQMTQALQMVAKTTHNHALALVITNAQWMPNTNTIVFQGNAEVLKEVTRLVSSLDGDAKATLKDQVLVYAPKHVSGRELLRKLQDLQKNFQQGDLQDEALLNTLSAGQWIVSSGTLSFTGSEKTLSKIQSLLASLDTQEAGTLYTYAIQHTTPQQMLDALQAIGDTSDDESLVTALQNVQNVAGTSLLLFQGSHATIERIKELLPTLDASSSISSKNQTLVYTPKYVSGELLVQRIQELCSNFTDTGLQDLELLQALQSAKWMQTSKTLAFTGNQISLDKVRALLLTLDDKEQSDAMETWTYKIEHTTQEQLKAAVEQLIASSHDEALVALCKNAQWSANVVLFHGSRSAIRHLQEILPHLDLSVSLSKNQILVYTPVQLSGNVLLQKLQELAQNFKASNLNDPSLLDALDSASLAPSSKTITFTGDARVLTQIQSLLSSLDTTTMMQSFLFKPSFATEAQLQSALANYAKNLNPEDPLDQELLAAIHNVEIVASSQSLLFKASGATLGRLKTILFALDTPQGIPAQEGNFTLYRCHVPGNLILQQLQNLADHLSPGDPRTDALIQGIRTLKWVQNNNTLLITGSPVIVEQIKALIVDFDNQALQGSSSQAEFFLYKPLNQTPDQVVSALQALATDLMASGLASGDLLHTLQSARTLSSGSVLITGTPDALGRARQFLSSVDIAANGEDIQTLGTTTFLIYKVQQANSDALLTSLRNFASTLSQTNITDQELAVSLGSVKWIAETHSLFFTGSEATLKKVYALAEKFDLGTQGTASQDVARLSAPAFVVYTPKVQTGSELISILYDFMQNLIHSGVSDPGLFDTINHLRFVAKTNSLIISGDPASIQKIQDLLIKFDVLHVDEPGSLASLDAANFLIYKLQYHSGNDIQAALKKVASSLNSSSPDTNKSLIDAINSLQWVEVTNSLIGSGEPAVLTRVRELLLNLDVPLRQVFIEVLVIETSVFNSQNFGLQWGSQFQYLNKTIGAMGNFPSVINNIINNTNSQSTGSVDISNPISNVTNTSPPVQGNSYTTPTAVPFSSGFDLGVIGDIIFHKGQSFISLGSLVNALQIDNDTTVIMNPKLITQDGHTSNIFVGQNIPFVGSFVSNTASNTVQSSNIEYRDVGVDLTITPSLGTNNIITLDIHQDISQQVQNNTQIQGSQVAGIQTSMTTMSTRVHVPDRHFLVLSGMIQDAKTHFRSSIPCLGGLPVIGALFSESDRYDNKNNVIIFLRPFIINSFEEYQRLTTAEEELYKQQAGFQDLKEEFDAGTEMIKDLHDE